MAVVIVAWRWSGGWGGVIVVRMAAAVDWDEGRSGSEWWRVGGVGSGCCHCGGWLTVGVAGQRGCCVEAVALVDRGVVVAAVAVGLWMVGRRVGASDIVDRLDRVIRILFGFAGKSSPEKFSGGGVVAGRRQWWPAKRLKIEKCNAKIEFSKPQREETCQVTLDSLKLSPCYLAFLITVEVLKVYMHQFWNTIKKIKDTDAYWNLVTLASVTCYLQSTQIICTSLGEQLLLSLTATPKKARKFKKVSSPSKKRSLILEEEHVEKTKRAKKPFKKSNIVPIAGVVIRDIFDAQLSTRLKDSIKKTFRSYTIEFAKKAQDERKRYIDLVEKSIKDIIKDEVKSQLPHILPKEVSEFATLMIQSTISESLENVRDSEDKDKDEDPPAGSDQGLKKGRQARMLNHQKALNLKNQSQAHPKAPSLNRNNL
nr:hypothetical protein [Tanacetum cinerariifolium]